MAAVVVAEVVVEAEEQALNETSLRSIRVGCVTHSHSDRITTPAAISVSVQIDKLSLIALIIRRKSMQLSTIFVRPGQMHPKAF